MPEDCFVPLRAGPAMTAIKKPRSLNETSVIILGLSWSTGRDANRKLQYQLQFNFVAYRDIVVAKKRNLGLKLARSVDRVGVDSL